VIDHDHTLWERLGLAGFISRYFKRQTLIAIGTVSAIAAILAVIAAFGNIAEMRLVLLLSGALLAMLSAAALAIAPSVEARSMVEKARIFIVAGQFQAALNLLNRAIELSPRLTSAYIARSAAYAGLSQIDLATEDAERAVKISPDLAAARLTRARLFSYRGLYEHAIHDLKTGIREKPDWTTGYLELVQLQVKLQDYEASLATLGDLGMHAETDQVKYDALILAGWIYEDKLNNIDGAITAYTRAIPVQPDRKIGYLRRAHAYRQRGDMFQAAEDLLRAAQRIEMPEDAGQYHWQQAACYWGRYTITDDSRDMKAMISALERSVVEDSKEFSEQSRQWLNALREKRLNAEALTRAMGTPPMPKIFPN
jgi:tetratricopeptide (TPR) repeat protein